MKMIVMPTRKGWLWFGIGVLLAAGVGVLWNGYPFGKTWSDNRNGSLVESTEMEHKNHVRHRTDPLVDRPKSHHDRVNGENQEQSRVERSKRMSAESSMRMDSATHSDIPQAATTVTATGRQLIGLKTEPVVRRSLETSIRAVGRVVYDERRITRVNLRFSGWVEKVFVGATGQRVRRGQPLLALYSPELVAAQDEYLLALETYEAVQRSPLSVVRDQARQLVEAARDRLRLWNLTDQQIASLVQRGRPRSSVTVYSPIEGYIIEKTADQGLFVEPRTTVYTIADLSSIWVLADIYEYEIPFVTGGESAILTFDAYPGETFSGTVSYVYPYVNANSRTLRVRLELSNPAVRFKPDMFGAVMIRVQRKPALAVPAEAVIDTGIRTVVFVEKGRGRFEPRVVTLGPKVGAYYEVLAGLHEGEKVVTSGTFLLDSESRLMASTSMMGALGMGGITMEQARMGAMEMGEMDMGAMEMGEKKMEPADRTLPGKSKNKEQAGEIVNDPKD